MGHATARVVIAFAVLAFGCNDKDDVKVRSSGSPAPGTAGATEPAIVGVIALPADAPAGTPTKGATIAVEGRPEVAVAADEAGNFVILPGQVAVSSLVGSAQSLNLIVTHSVGSDHYALRQEDVVFVEGNRTDLGKVGIKWAGSISGQVRRYGQADHAGIDVYIPGTSFLAKTDESGNFSLPVVPEGRWRLRFETAGFVKHVADDVAVVARRPTTLPLLELGLDTGPAGTILPINGGKLLGSQSADVAISYSSNATLMILSEDKSFAGATWQPSARLARFTFGGSGPRTLYAKFADANGQESAPVSGTVEIDVAPPDQGAVVINAGAPYTKARQVTLAIAGNDAGGIVEMQISEAPAFDGATWIPFAASAPWTLSEGDGPKTVYVRLKDVFGYVTPYRISNGITLDTTGAQPVTVAVANGAIVKSRSITLNVSAADGGSGVKQIRVGEDMALAGAAIPFAASIPFELSAGDGNKTVYLAVEDQAGNLSPVATASVTLDQTPPGAATLSATVDDKDCDDSDGFASRMKIALSWTKPAGASEVWILRKNDSYPANETDGVLVTAAASATTHSESHTTLARLTAHYYRAFAKDAAGNFSAGATAVAVPRTVLGCRLYPLEANRDASGAYQGNSAANGWRLSSFGANHAVAMVPSAPNQLRIFTTSDGGATWARSREPANEMLKAVTLRSTTDYIGIMGVNSQITSTDGGATWSGPTGLGLAGAPNDAAWSSPSKGYITGFGDEFAYTSNGGTSWTMADCGIGGVPLDKLVAFDGGGSNATDTIWMTGMDATTPKLYKVTNTSGTTATCTSIAISPTTTAINFLAAFDANTALIGCGACGPGQTFGVIRVLGTTATSYEVTEPLLTSSPAFVGASFRDANTAFFQMVDGGLHSALIKISSFGTSPVFTRQLVTKNDAQSTVPYYNNFQPKDVHFATPTRAYMLLAEGTYGDGLSLLSSGDGGASWTYAEATTRATFMDVAAFDANTATAVGAHATVATTTDSGANWVSRIHTVGPSGASMRAISFAPGTQVGYAVGIHRAAMKSTDRGQTWTGLTISGASTATTFEDVAAATASLVVAVGDGSSAGNSTSRAIWVSTDGGTTWTDRSSVGGPVGLRAVSMMSATEGVVVGDAGAMLKTVDGGQTWFALADSFSTDFKDVHFVDTRTGWISGKDGVVMKTTDGGASWTLQPFQATGLLKRIFFLDEKVGWTILDDNVPPYVQTIFATTNGGSNWFKVEVPERGPNTNNYRVEGLGGVKVGGAYHVFATGSYGNIHKIQLTAP